MFFRKWKDRILRQKQDIIDLSHRINCLQKEMLKQSMKLSDLIKSIKKLDHD